MYYKLGEAYQLRGWKHLTGMLTDRLGRQVKILSGRGLSLLMLCDGTSDLEAILLDPKMKEIMDELLKEEIVVTTEEPTPIRPAQRYKYYDNRYFSSVLWSITGRCNYRCRHCYMDAPDAAQGELPLEDIKSIIDQLAKCGIRAIDLTGGEPLVRKDFWEIVDYMRKRGLYVEQLYTNGWLLTDEVLGEFEKRGMHPEISISFDGIGWHDWMRGVKGAEDRALEALKSCVKKGFPCNVELCLHKGNKNTLRETVNALAEIGVPAVKVGKVSETDLWKKNSEGNSLSMKEHYDAMLEYVPHFYEDGMPMRVMLGGGIDLRAHTTDYWVVSEKSDGSEENCKNQYLCASARFTAYISPEGRLLPCMSITSIEAQKEFPLILEHGLKECMTDGYYMNFIGNRVKDLLERNEKCNTCEYRYKCCGGCRAIAMVGNGGELYSSDPEACFLYENGYPEKYHKAADEAIAKYCKDFKKDESEN